MKKTLVYTLILSAFAISLATFIFTPFTADLCVLLAGSRQADMLGGNIISNPIMQWDLKGAFLRLTIYMIYKAVNPYVDMLGTGLRFHVAVNSIFCACVIIVISLSVIIANGVQQGRKNFFAVLAMCAAIFATLPNMHIQPEMICAVILILSFAMYINAVRTKRFFMVKLFIAGFIAAGIIFFKSVFALIAFSFMAGIILWSRKHNHAFSFRQSLVVVAGGLVMISLSFAIILSINPNEIQNMLDAAIWQHTFISGSGSVIRGMAFFLKNFAYAALTAPVIIYEIFCGAGNLLDDIRGHDYACIVARLALWIFPAVTIMLANTYFFYHYFLFVAPAMLEIYLAGKRIKLISAIILTVPAIVYICFMSLFSVYFSESVKLFSGTYSESMKIISAVNIDKSATVMYLDDGAGAYMLGNKSYLDEYYPLPLQRVGEDSEYPAHVKTLRKALNFNGRYITVCDSWFFGDGNNKRIRDKINSEYQKIGSLPVYSIGFNIFRRPSRERLQHNIDIYERITR